MQPWRVHVLTGEPKERLSAALVRAHAEGAPHGAEYKYYPDGFFEPYLARRRKVGWDLYGLLGIARGETARMQAQHARNLVFFDAPVGMIFTIDRRLEIGSWLDYGIFLGNVMTAARGHGLDTCAQAAFAPFHATIRRELGLGAEEVVVCGLSIGYEDTAAPENAAQDRARAGARLRELSRLGVRENRMQERNLGSSGLRVSLVGLGCNNFGGRIDLEATRKVVHKALDLGITLFDTADVYGERGGSERFLGEVLGERRKDIVLATKFGMDMDDAGRMKGGSRAYVMKAVEDSLRRLKTDWIDLYQLHRADPLTPIEETLRALDDLIRQGKVRYIGCSNLAAWQVVEAQWTAETRNLNAFASCQDEYSLVVRDIERELVPAIEAYRMGLLPFFPLASGLLTGKYKRDAPPPKGTRLATTQRLADRYMTQGNWRKVEGLADFAKRHGRSLLELAFSWLAAKSYVSSVIAGATKPEQLEQNVKAVEWALTPEDLAEIDRLAFGS